VKRNDLLVLLPSGTKERIFPLLREVELPLGKENYAAGHLQAQQLIRYARGHIQVLSRPGLEAVACQCYPAGLSAYERQYGQTSGNS
jgi:hypothetical protein